MKCIVRSLHFVLTVALLFVSAADLKAVPCTAGTTFHWSSDVLRWGGNDVWTFGSAYIDGYYMWYWRPKVTTTSTLNGQVLFGRLNVIAYAGYGEEAVNQWHDAPQNVGTGLYGVSNIIEYLPDPGCDAISPINNSESLGVSRPYISGLNGIWWLGGGSDPANGYYNQGALTANKNCGAGDICNETPYWTVTLNPQKISLSCTVCNSNVATSLVPSQSLGDITILIDIGGFQSPAFNYTVNAPYRMSSSSPYVLDQTYQDGYWSYIYYRTYDLFGNAMPSIALNEQFGAFVNDQANNWAKPTAGGLSQYGGYDWWDNMYMYNCSSCSPPVQNPQNPLTNNRVDHAAQSWRIGSSTVGSGVLVQNNTHQRYTDHGRHTNIVSPVN